MDGVPFDDSADGAKPAVGADKLALYPLRFDYAIFVERLAATSSAELGRWLAGAVRLLRRFR
jgi:hypothetical protein